MKFLTVKKIIIKEFVKDKPVIHHITLDISFLALVFFYFMLLSPDQNEKCPFKAYHFCL